MRAGWSEASEPCGADSGDASDRGDSVRVALAGPAGGFCSDDGIYAGGVVGDRAECAVFSCGVCLPSQGTAAVGCFVREFRSVAVGGGGSSVVDASVGHMSYFVVREGDGAGSGCVVIFGGWLFFLAVFGRVFALGYLTEYGIG